MPNVNDKTMAAKPAKLNNNFILVTPAKLEANIRTKDTVINAKNVNNKRKIERYFLNMVCLVFDVKN